MLSVRVSQDPTGPMGQAIVSVSGLPRVLETFEFALSRHEFAANHLGLEGWQSAECWMQPDEAWHSGDILKFVVAPNLVSQLENRPYQLALRGQGLAGTAAAMFVWPLKLEREDGIRAGVEPTNDPLPTLVRPPRRAAMDAELPTRVVVARTRASRSSPLNATDDQPTRRAPGRRIPSAGNGARNAGGRATPAEVPAEPGSSRESPTPATSRPESGREAFQSNPAGVVDEQRRRKLGTLWIGLVLAVAVAAVTGWWWHGHPFTEEPMVSDPASPVIPPLRDPQSGPKALVGHAWHRQ